MHIVTHYWLADIISTNFTVDNNDFFTVNGCEIQNCEEQSAVYLHVPIEIRWVTVLHKLNMDFRVLEWSNTKCEYIITQFEIQSELLLSFVFHNVLYRVQN